MCIRDRLDRVMEAAADQGLSVMLRVGYTWDYYGRDDVLSRYRGLMYDGDIRDAWMEYVGRLYGRASSHEMCIRDREYWGPRAAAKA